MRLAKRAIEHVRRQGKTKSSGKLFGERVGIVKFSQVFSAIFPGMNLFGHLRAAHVQTLNNWVNNDIRERNQVGTLGLTKRERRNDITTSRHRLPGPGRYRGNRNDGRHEDAYHAMPSVVAVKGPRLNEVWPLADSPIRQTPATRKITTRIIVNAILSVTMAINKLALAMQSPPDHATTKKPE